MLEEGDRSIDGLATDLFVVAHDIAEAAANAGFPRTVVKPTLLAVNKSSRPRFGVINANGQLRVLARCGYSLAVPRAGSVQPCFASA